MNMMKKYCVKNVRTTMIKPDYYITSKPKVKDELRLRRCFRCGKEKKMGKFERYCSIACRNYATKHDTSAYKIVW